MRGPLRPRRSGSARPARDGYAPARPWPSAIDLRSDTVTQPDRRDAPRDGRGRGRRRRLRRRPDGHRARGARRRAARQGSRPVRRQRHAWATSSRQLAHVAARRRDRSPARAATLVHRRGGRPRGRRRGVDAAAPRATRRHGSISTRSASAFRDPHDAARADHRRWSRSRTPTPTRWASRCPRTTSRAVAAIAHERGVPLHVDGARFFNAVVALGRHARRSSPDRPTRPPSACRRGSPARSARSSSARATSSGARAARASWSAAACARSGVLAAAGLIALRDGPAG